MKKLFKAALCIATFTLCLEKQDKTLIPYPDPHDRNSQKSAKESTEQTPDFVYFNEKKYIEDCCWGIGTISCCLICCINSLRR